MDPRKTLDPHKNDQTWLLSGCVAMMFLLRVQSQTRLLAQQALLMESRQKLVSAQQRWRASLLEHRRKE